MALDYPPVTDEPNPSADSPPRLRLIGRSVAVPRRQEPADPVRGDELAESARVVDDLVIPLSRLVSAGDEEHLSTFIVQSSFESSLELILRGLAASPRD
jgi:hypothetical protein